MKVERWSTAAYTPKRLQKVTLLAGRLPLGRSARKRMIAAEVMAQWGDAAP